MINIGNLSATKIYAGSIEISKAYLGDEQVYPSSTPPTPSYDMPLTFEIIDSGNIMLKYDGDTSGKTIQYSKNGGEWTNATFASGSGFTISVVSGDTLQFRGNNDSYYEFDGWNLGYHSWFDSTAHFNAKGNIMSLINYNFDTLVDFFETNCFYRLFRNCTKLTNVENLLLPATGLTENCYYGMFDGCSFTKTPELPATILANGCYEAMFFNCVNLTSVTTLPSLTLANNCYYSMFEGCYSLILAPELPALMLANDCYYHMFRNCYLIGRVKCLATDISASGCTENWLEGVPQTGTFITPSSTNWTTGASGIPSGWTRVNA